MYRYSYQSPYEEPFYLPRLLLAQTISQSNREAPRATKKVLYSTSSLADPGLTQDSSSAGTVSDLQDPSMLPEDSWISILNDTRLRQTARLVYKRRLNCIGFQFETHPDLSTEPKQHEGYYNASDDFARYQAVQLGEVHSLNVAPDDGRLAKRQPTIPSLWKNNPGGGRVEQPLEKKFRSLFQTSPNLLALYGRVQLGNGDSSNSTRGGSGGHEDLPTPKGNQHSGQRSDHLVKIPPGQDDNNQEDKNNKDDKKGKKNRDDLARTRFLQWFPEREFLCVILVGDPVRAEQSGCAHHTPNIAEIFRVRVYLHAQEIKLTLAASGELPQTTLPADRRSALENS